MLDPAQDGLQVVFQPIGRKIRVPSGSTLLESAQRAGIDIVASCGGVGICGTCRIRILQGKVSPITPDETAGLREDEIAGGFRLACQVIPLSDVMVDVPPSSLARAQQLQIEGVDTGVHFAPSVRAVDLQLSEPTLSDLRADLARVDAALDDFGLQPLAATPSQIDELSRKLRSSGWSLRLVVHPASQASEFVGCLPSGAQILGIALDVGSTKIALYLVDLETGGTLATSGIMNPQIAYGEDVVSRIAYANRSEHHRKELQRVLVDSINQAAIDLYAQVGACPDQICDWVVVGNTAIHHLFCGLPVEPLGRAPYVPVVQRDLAFRASEIGLVGATGAQIYLPPNIAGFVGADHVSALVAARIQSHRTSLLMDIGTNTEISLVHDGRIFTCSCASGPAFEGAHIRDGMRAIPGAIERVRLSGGNRIVHTIGGLPPIGLCGSGILSAVAEMRRGGWIDEHGRLRRTSKDGFTLVPAAQTGHGQDIVVTRKDINEIQLAKAAIRTGIEILFRQAEIQAGQVEEWIVAGAFGTHIDIGAAMAVGMIPKLPLERFRQIGNAAGVGSRQMLLSTHRRAEACSFLDQIQYVELTTQTNFQVEFMRSLSFPEQTN